MRIENQPRFKKFNQNLLLTCNITTPSIDQHLLSPLRFISLFQTPTSMSESSLRIILFPWLVCPYFEPDIEQDEMCKALLIKQQSWTKLLRKLRTWGAFFLNFVADRFFPPPSPWKQCCWVFKRKPDP